MVDPPTLATTTFYEHFSLVKCRVQKHRWIPRRKQEKAKTLDVIRKEAEMDLARGGQQQG